MARLGRKDRGLLARKDTAGKTLWYVRLWHESHERRFGSFATKTAAREFYEKAKLEQQEGRFFPERYQHGGYKLVEDFLSAHVARRTQRRDQRSEKGFKVWWSTWFRGKRLNAVTVDALERARRELLTQGSDPTADPPRPCSPQRVNRYLSWLRHALNIAVRSGKLPNNPVQKLGMYKEPSGHTRYLNLEEEAVLYQAIGPVYAPWVRLAILTGLRRSEQLSLRWHDVNLPHGVLTLRQTKAGGVQYVRLNQEAKHLLERLHAVPSAQAIASPACRSSWVFPSENPEKPIDACNFYRRVYLKAVKDANLNGVTWHTLRHTFASRAAMSGQAEGTIAAMLRHSSTTLVRRYAHLSPAHLQTAMVAVAAFGKPVAPLTQHSVPQANQSEQVLNGTVTQTGIPAGHALNGSMEVIENNGAGDLD